MIAVNIDNLHCSYGKDPILQEISFSIKTGEFFIIIGPNGSGKTTLLKVINSIIKPQRGSMELLDSPFQSYTRKALARLLALVPQEVPSDFPFTVHDVVLMGRYPHLGVFGLEKEQDQKIAKEAMEFTDILHLGTRRLSQLSGGERQRVFIARAICQEPQIILLDEPTASLDLAHQVRTMDLMEQLKNEKGITVIMVSHDINLAAMYGDRLLLLKEGKILKIGTPAEVITFAILEEAYGCVLMVNPSPLGNFPQVTLVPHRILHAT